MRVLTVRQPWAWAIVAALKRVENRTWQTTYRGPLLIHAALSRAGLPDAGLRLLPSGLRPEDLPLGAIIGVVRLLDCVRPHTLRRRAGWADDPDVAGPWCWVLGDPRPLPEPYPCAGRLGLWVPPADVILA